jgi:RNA polymerase sigma factor (sigma-70 family)
VIDIDAAYRTHGPMVLRRARTLLGSDSEAQDLLQEVFASLVARPEQFRAQSRLSTFLYAVTTHACLKRMHQRKNRARLVELFVKPGAIADEAGTPPSGDTLVLVRALIERAPPDEAEAVAYAWVDGMTLDEVAEVMGCSRRHVADLLSRFRERASRLTRDAA